VYPDAPGLLFEEPSVPDDVPLAAEEPESIFAEPLVEVSEDEPLFDPAKAGAAPSINAAAARAR
jgi:hypothetical protein